MFTIKTDLCSISIDVNKPDEDGALIYSDVTSPYGDDYAQELLSRSHGLFGHNFNGKTGSPLDLNSATRSSLAKFNPVITDGAKMLESYSYEFPVGTLS